MALRHLRHAVRRLLKQHAFFLTTSLALGFGVGCATVGFSVVEALVLRALPLVDPDELVVLTELDKDGRSRAASLGALQEWQSHTEVFSGVAGYRLHDLNLTGKDRPTALIAASVTSDFLPLLHQKASIGRLFTEDEAEGDMAVVVLTHPFWMSRFGGRNNVIGEQLSLADRNHSIVGVLPSDFRFLDYVPDVLIPLSSRPESVDSLLRSSLPVVLARLQKGGPLKPTPAPAARVGPG